jgi:hypothetical protein
LLLQKGCCKKTGSGPPAHQDAKKPAAAGFLFRMKGHRLPDRLRFFCATQNRIVLREDPILAGTLLMARVAGGSGLGDGAVK